MEVVRSIVSEHSHMCFLLAEAVDAAAAQGLAALVPAQLLRAASTALQARLAQLRSTLSAVDNGLVAIGVGEHRGEDGEAEVHGVTMPSPTHSR